MQYVSTLQTLKLYKLLTSDLHAVHAIVVGNTHQ